MNLFLRVIGFMAFAIISSTAFAKTFKYDFTGIHSSNGFVNYPGLDFSQAKTVTLTVSKDPLTPEVTVNSAEITFPNAARLIATGFKKLDNTDTYRAVVNNAWIYRQVIVDISGTDFNRAQNNRVNINVSVSEKSVFIEPEDDVKGHPLFFVDGDLRDITTPKIVDTDSVILDGKRVNLSLRENLSFASPGTITNGAREGFVLDVLWMGKGQKTIYIPAPIPQGEYDRYDAIGLVLEELNGPLGKEYSLRVNFKDASGSQESLPPQPLKLILEQAFTSNN